MESSTIFIIVGLLYCALFFLDTLFKSCSHYPYLYFLHNTGLQIELFRIKWFTTAFNRTIQKCGTWRPRLIDKWFAVGVKCSLAILPLAIYIVIKTAVNAWQRSIGNSDIKSTMILQPVVPGVNLPLSHIGYYMTTLVTCSVVHELGHAIAAVREDIHVSGVGVNIVLIIPIAYVHLDTEQYESLSPWKQLSVICAGVWHNIVLAAIAALLFMFLPLIIYPFFDVGNGISVQNIHQQSPLLGQSGLQVGNQILAINDCKVKDYNTWYNCILHSLKHSSPGFCVSSELVKEHDESVAVKQLPGGVIECCSANSPNHLCFEYLEKDGNMPELPQHSCLPGRIVIETSKEMCSISNECSEGLHCLKPSLDNQTKLVSIERANNNIVIFLGHPSEIFHTVEISDFVPLYFIPSSIPEVIKQMCVYLIVFSSGLAVINIIPCYYFDGQYIIQSLINILLVNKIEYKSVRQGIALSITICGTVFIFGNFISILLLSVF